VREAHNPGANDREVVASRGHRRRHAWLRASQAPVESA
jgi:hypothetical protein